MRTAAGGVSGLAAAALVIAIAGPTPAGLPIRGPHVSEAPSGRLQQIAIHYAPAFDPVALPVWRQLLPALPHDLVVDVVVAERADFDQLHERLAGWGVAAPERFRPVVTGGPITTWARDRLAAVAGPDGPEILAPPRTKVPFAGRAGDALAPHALARAMGGREGVAEIVFEGGDLVSTPHTLFVDVNLLGRNLGRVGGGRAAIEAALHRHFTQQIVWLGDRPGEVPEHHIMMYMMPLDDRTVLVGDVHAGMALRGADGPALDPAIEEHARRFDRAAALLGARGFHVLRVPALVLPGGGTYVTYTNALFDRDDAGPVVYLPTYGLPALDGVAGAIYHRLGFRVVPIDVSSIYTLEGSLGCLVAVLARGAR